MKIDIFNYLPLIASILVALIILTLSRISWNALNEFRMRMRRIQIVNRYQFSSKSASKKINRQVNMAKIVLGTYGDRLVRNSYKSKLEKMLVTSGDWENRKFAVLIQRKVYFALIGFGITFILLLLKNISFLPIVSVVIIFSYFLPDIENFFQKMTGRRYRKKLKNLLDQSGSWKEKDRKSTRLNSSHT